MTAPAGAADTVSFMEMRAAAQSEVLRLDLWLGRVGEHAVILEVTRRRFAAIVNLIDLVSGDATCLRRIRDLRVERLKIERAEAAAAAAPSTAMPLDKSGPE